METLDALLPSNAVVRKTLADVIFAKLESGEIGNAAVIQKSHQSIIKNAFMEKSL
jgi:essential nuclear protein 1